MNDRLLSPVREVAKKLGIGGRTDPDEKLSFPNQEKEDIPTAIVDLPSGGVFYKGVMSIGVCRTLSVAQVRQLYSIRNLTSQYNRKRELVNIIGRSIKGFDFLDMTWPDFQYVMYWLRLNTYKKTPYSISWEYQPAAEGDGPPPPKKTVLSMVGLTDFRIHTLDRHRKFQYEYETVRMYLERLELQDEGEIYISQQAACYHRGGNTLRARLDALDRCSDDVLFEIRAFQQEAHHGVHPVVKLRDPDNPKAGPFEFVLEMDVADFFQ
jgi:hypothetical protein